MTLHTSQITRSGKQRSSFRPLLLALALVGLLALGVSGCGTSSGSGGSGGGTSDAAGTGGGSGADGGGSGSGSDGGSSGGGGDSDSATVEVMFDVGGTTATSLSSRTIPSLFNQVAKVTVDVDDPSLAPADTLLIRQILEPGNGGLWLGTFYGLPPGKLLIFSASGYDAHDNLLISGSISVVLNPGDGSLLIAGSLVVSPISLDVTPKTASVAAGTSQAYEATATFPDSIVIDVTETVSWSTTGNASISNKGTATGTAPGSATVTATLGDLSDSAALTVTDAELVSLAITPPGLTLALGTGAQLTARGTFTDSSTQDLTEEVSWDVDGGEVEVAADGSLNTLATGSADITASLDGVEATVTVTVTEAELVSLDVTPLEPSLAKGNSLQMTAMGTFTDESTQDLTGDVVWSSTASGVVGVSASGTISGLAVGTADITATVGGISDTQTVEVTTAELEALFLTPLEPSLTLGGTLQLTATGLYSDDSEVNLSSSVTWSSDDTDVLTVSNAPGSKGLVSSPSEGYPGYAGITATVPGGSGLSASVDVTVTDALLVSLAIDQDDGISLGVGVAMGYTVTGYYSNDSTQNLPAAVTWSSSNASVAALLNNSGQEGQVLALTPGTITVTAQLPGSGNEALNDSVTLSIESDEVCPLNGLVVNGSFECPAVTHGAKWDLFTSSELNGWQVEWRDPEFACGGDAEPVLELQKNGVLGGISAPNGVQYAELDTDCGGPSNGGWADVATSVTIYQDLLTVPGHTYTVSFYARARDNNHGSMTLAASWNGETLLDYAAPGLNWVLYAFEVTATESLTRLAITDTGLSQSFGILLDDVRVD